MKESEIQAAVLETLAYFPQVGYFWRNNSTGIYDPTRKIFRKPRGIGWINGTPDIIGIAHNGQFIGIEVKTARKGLTQAQRDFEKNCRKYCGEYLLVRSVEEIIVWIESRKLLISRF